MIKLNMFNCCVNDIIKFQDGEIGIIIYQNLDNENKLCKVLYKKDNSIKTFDKLNNEEVQFLGIGFYQEIKIIKINWKSF